MHLYRRGLIGNKPLNKVFKPGKLNDCRIVVFDVNIKMRQCQWWPGLLHPFMREWTGKEGLNKTFKPDTTNSCRTMDVRLGTVTVGHLYHHSKGDLYHLSSLWDDRSSMLKKSSNMQHIYMMNGCIMRYKGRWITIEKYNSMKHTWLKFRGSTSK
jgi:hypothetical protein